jgi:hypothetical protein
MTELLLGCGHSRAKLLALPGAPLEWTDLVTLDINRRCNPDILCDLGDDWCGERLTTRGFEATKATGYLCSDYFEEVHAYEVLEHLGQQGDARSFFWTFDNIWRVLKPGGHLFATVPSRYSAWLWGDPSHRRVICAESLAFLSQDVIARNRQAGSAMSDFSDLWTRDFKILSATDNRERFMFCLQAIKP